MLSASSTPVNARAWTALAAEITATSTPPDDFTLVTITETSPPIVCCTYERDAILTHLAAPTEAAPMELLRRWDHYGPSGRPLDFTPDALVFSTLFRAVHIDRLLRHCGGAN